MNKYIIELLRLQTSVIIPGFGSLMITSTKSGSVVFNALLKFNDGALAKYIAEKEGIDQQNAQNQIAKFVREIEAELAKGNDFGIFQLGKFKKNNSGDIVFIQDQASLTTLKTDGEPAEKKSEPALNDKKEEIKHAVVEKIDETKVTSTATDQIKSLSDTLNTSEAEIKKQAADEIKNQEIKPQIEKEIPVKQDKNIFVPADQNSSLEKKGEQLVDKKIESAKADISKNIPLATASKKEPLQEKNIFKPTEENKTDSKPAQTAPEKPADVASENKNQAEPIKTNTTDKVKSDKKEEPKKESVKEKFRKDKPQKVKNQPVGEKKPKKKKRTLMWIIIIIILGGGGYAGWHFRDKINAFLHTGVNSDETDSTHAQTTTPHDSTATDVHTDVSVQDTVMTETETETQSETEVESQQTEHETTTVQTNHSSGGSYHIIGNSFSSETNADNYVKKMREKGYDATNLGKQSNGLYMVSLRSFATREEAKAGLEAVKADASGAYVYKGR